MANCIHMEISNIDSSLTLYTNMKSRWTVNPRVNTDNKNSFYKVMVFMALSMHLSQVESLRLRKELTNWATLKLRASIH